MQFSDQPIGDVQQNGHTTAEIQEEVALTNMAATGNNKRHSNQDKLQFPRNNLHTITTLGTETAPNHRPTD